MMYVETESRKFMAALMKNVMMVIQKTLMAAMKIA